MDKKLPQIDSGVQREPQNEPVLDVNKNFHVGQVWMTRGGHRRRIVYVYPDDRDSFVLAESLDGYGPPVETYAKNGSVSPGLPDQAESVRDLASLVSAVVRSDDKPAYPTLHIVSIPLYEYSNLNCRVGYLEGVIEGLRSASDDDVHDIIDYALVRYRDVYCGGKQG